MTTPAPIINYESCVSQLTGGKLVSDLDKECQKILGIASSVLARRNSAAWNSKTGHDARQYQSTVVGGAAMDVATKPEEPSISDIFLSNKSPEERKEIKQKIARTASKGGMVRSDDVVSEADVEKARAKLAAERAKAKESHPHI